MQHNNSNPAKILHVTRDIDNVELDTTMGINFNFPHLVSWKNVVSIMTTTFIGTSDSD